MLIYQLDELAIFLVAVVTLKAGKLEDAPLLFLQLAGGMLMLTLAVVMLINPAWMNQISSSLLIFVIAFAATGLVLLVHRLLLPRWGTRLGSELAPATRKQGSKRQRQQTHR